MPSHPSSVTSDAGPGEGATSAEWDAGGMTASGSASLDPVELACELIRIDSVNPDLVEAGAGESAIATYCLQWFDRHGFETHWLERTPGRPSVVGILRGSGGGRSIMLNGHLDTVTLTGYDGAALEPRIVRGQLHGRGAFDMKSGLAAMMVAAARTADDSLAGDVIVALVADEECGSLGTEELLTRFTADAAVVSEPSLLQITTEHRGFMWFEVDVHGVAAHGSRPDLAVDAIARAARVITAIEGWDERLAAGPAHPALATGRVHVSLVRGGVEGSSYPALCSLLVERRTVPGEFPDAIEAELAAVLDQVRVDVPDLEVTWRRTLTRAPFSADLGAPMLAALIGHAEVALGQPPILRAEPFWTDCALLAEAGIPGVLFGVDGEGAHAATEWADVASIGIVTDVIEATIRDFCR